MTASKDTAGKQIIWAMIFKHDRKPRSLQMAQKSIYEMPHDLIDDIVDVADATETPPGPKKRTKLKHDY